jgi:hypothetical protein
VCGIKTKEIKYLYSMATLNDIRNRVIDSLMSIDNSQYLQALEKMIKSSNIEHSKIPLTEDQKIMLTMSDDDILNGKMIDQDSLNKQELQWLKEK